MPDAAVAHMQKVLDSLGFVGDPEMADTARRFTEFLGELRAEGPPSVSVCASSMPGQVVAICDVPFHSLCAHHLLPFSGTVSIAYRAGERLAGLGAIPRVVRWASRQPQLQERMANALAEVLVDRLQPQGVAVRIEARHYCVEMRGSESPARVVVQAERGDVTGLWAAM